MIDKISSIGTAALKEVSDANTLDKLEEVRVRVLGKKGSFSEVLKGLGALSADERPKVGAVTNEWKAKIEAAIEEQKNALSSAALEQSLQKEKVDGSLPSRVYALGSLHVITQTTRRLIKTFSRLGFDLTTGPEAETEYLNFEAVNIPADHPARDMQDTFFLGPGVVLRTHTSAVQMRAMRMKPAPLRVICPGAVFRADNDATHSPMFHQIEGLWIDKDVRMSDLKGVLEFFAKETFGTGSKIRLRPSYFPFVEPGAEVDVSCFQCSGTGFLKNADPCRLCKTSGWIEILGAGMVHPRLIEMAGYPADLTGFAFGMGIERISMLIHQIPDMRLLFQNDQRFLSQFR